jgi:hypothetical protein
MTPRFQLQQAGAPEWPLRQVEGPVAGLVQKLERFCFFLFDWNSSQIHRLYGHGLRRVDDLHWGAVVRSERGAQHFVTARNLCKALFERGDFEKPFDLKNVADVVDRAAWLPLIEKPQLLLTKRQRPRFGQGALSN